MEHVQNGWDFSIEVSSDLEGNKRANWPFQGRKNKKKEKKEGCFYLLCKSPKGLPWQRDSLTNWKSSGKEFVHISALLFFFL